MSNRNTPSSRPRTRRGVDSILTGPVVIILVARAERLSNVSLDFLRRSEKGIGGGTLPF